MAKPKLRAKITDVHKYDAFVNDKLVNSIIEFDAIYDGRGTYGLKLVLHKSNVDGYLTGYAFCRKINAKVFFYAIKVEVIKRKKRKKDEGVQGLKFI